MLWETTRLAVQAILRNALRSFLTVLGIIIGVAAVIAMVTIGQGSSVQVTEDVEKLGTNVLMMAPGGEHTGPFSGSIAPMFDLKDVDALIEQINSVETAAPSSSSNLTVIFGNENVTTMVTGTDTRYLSVVDWEISLGRAFLAHEEQSGTPVCILGETVRQSLFGNTTPIGDSLRVKNMPCKIVGVLAPKGASSFGTDQDDVILMPIKTFQRRISGRSDVSMVFISVRDGVSTERAMGEVEALMRERRRIRPGEEDDFGVMDVQQIAAMLTGITAILTGLLSAVAAVSLLVGGIGIMNIMLVSVTERTREIGIRLAVGAQAGQVMMQFLVEAIVLSLIGGVLGIALGLGLAAFASNLMNIPFSPDPLIVLLAFVFSAVVGVIFGYFPARRAARLDPIEALRHQ